jgi:hypothetical protein
LKEKVEMTAPATGSGDPDKTKKTSGDPKTTDGKSTDDGTKKADGADGEPKDLDELQSELARIRKALKDANKEAETNRKRLKDYEGVDPKRYAELEELQQRLDEDKAKATGDFDKLKDQLIQDRDGWKHKYESEVGDRRQERISNALLAAASDPDVDAVSGEQIVMLYSSEFELDEKNKIVPKSALAINDDGKPMSPKEFLLKERETRGANLFKSSLKSGSGAGGGSTDSPTDVVRISKSDRKNKVALFEQARKDGKKVEWVE